MGMHLNFVQTIVTRSHHFFLFRMTPLVTIPWAKLRNPGALSWGTGANINPSIYVQMPKYMYWKKQIYIMYLAKLYHI